MRRTHVCDGGTSIGFVGEHKGASDVKMAYGKCVLGLEVKTLTLTFNP